jgi:hypothetical protein
MKWAKLNIEHLDEGIGPAVEILIKHGFKKLKSNS